MKGPSMSWHDKRLGHIVRDLKKYSGSRQKKEGAAKPPLFQLQNANNYFPLRLTGLVIGISAGITKVTN